ncbi:unnamed protein product [Linum trigynum]|uniref:Uncharacterized protein n=1 Tax=Linum trigynum TaxID=586398 RepID=A0AAV2CWU7_9ROSI
MVAGSAWHDGRRGRAERGRGQRRGRSGGDSGAAGRRGQLARQGGEDSRRCGGQGWRWAWERKRELRWWEGCGGGKRGRRDGDVYGREGGEREGGWRS